MKVKIGDLRHNPFENPNDPLDEKKLDDLRHSIEDNDFWGGLPGRIANDTPEIAFGRHRLAVLMEKYGPDYEINLEIHDDWSDETMLKVMAEENSATYNHDMEEAIRMVRAVVIAYADDRIKLKAPSGRKDQFRYAPSFKLPQKQLKSKDKSDLRPPVASSAYVYTANTIADFLRWAQHKTSCAVQILELIEIGLAEDSDFKGLSPKEAEKTNVKIRKDAREEEERKAREVQAKKDLAAKKKAEADARKAREEKEAAAKIAEEAKSEEERLEAKKKVEEATEKVEVAEKEVEKAKTLDEKTKAQLDREAERKKRKNINLVANKLTLTIGAMLKKDNLDEKLHALDKNKEYLEIGVRRELAKTLEVIGVRFYELAEKFQPKEADEDGITIEGDAVLIPNLRLITGQGQKE